MALLLRVFTGQVPEPVVYLFIMCLVYACVPYLFRCYSPLISSVARFAGDELRWWRVAAAVAAVVAVLMSDGGGGGGGGGGMERWWWRSGLHGKGE